MPEIQEQLPLSFYGEPEIEKNITVVYSICIRTIYSRCWCRFLATEESYTLAMQYRVGVTTVRRMVSEVCYAIRETMGETRT